MPLDEVTRRSVFIHQHELRRMVERERLREERGESVHYDSGSRMATWESRRGDLIGRWYGEAVASYVVRDRILRWAWAGRSSVSSVSHAEVIALEGEARGIPQLTMSLVAELDEEEATMLARLGTFVAGGVGLTVHRDDEGEEVSFIGLFDSPRPREGEGHDASRYSVPPMPVATTRSSAPPPHPAPRTSAPPRSPVRTIPPIREIYGPRAARVSSTPPPPVPREIREPARSIFVPVATAAFAALAKAAPGFQQALFVLSIDAAGTLVAGSDTEKSRLVVLLVAQDEAGILRSIDPPAELVEAAARMVDADRNDGNGPWRKLSARFTPKPNGGATLHVDVI